MRRVVPLANLLLLGAALPAMRRRTEVIRAELATTRRLQAEAEQAAQALRNDRALALGERARDLIDSMTGQGVADAKMAELADLPGPLPRPLAPGTRTPAGVGGAYRLPVTGDLLTDLGEISPAGVRSRGLTFRVTPGASVIAPPRESSATPARSAATGPWSSSTMATAGAAC